MTFAGFPARPQATPIPHVFFSDVLPHLGDPLALGVVLYALHELARTRGFPRYVTAAQLAEQASLAAFLSNAGGAGVSAAVGEGLARAVQLQVLLPLTVEREGARCTLYFLNAPADRRGLEAVRGGAVDVGRVVPQAVAAAVTPGIYALYESLVGPLSPLVADELLEAERLYPAEWIEAAFREAAAQNARSWRYISRILERWAIEGPDDATTERDPAGDGRYFLGKYGRILQQRIER